MKAEELQTIVVDETNYTIAVEATPHSHSSHPHRSDALKRLARIEGHVRAVKRMVENDVDCPDVLVQIAAVRSALDSVGKLILEDHMQGCMLKAAKDGEFEEAFRDLKKSIDRFIG